MEDFLEEFSAKQDLMKYRNQKIAFAVMMSFNTAFQKDESDVFDIEFVDGTKKKLYRPVRVF